MQRPEMATTPVDPLADPTKQMGISSAPSSDTPSDSGWSNPQYVNRHTGAPLTKEEVERQKKLGIVLVSLGAAREESVFGSENSEAMKAFREGRSPSLIVINRREDDSDVHPIKWYKPWTWWMGGAQISPLRWERLKDPQQPRSVDDSTVLPAMEATTPKVVVHPRAGVKTEENATQTEATESAPATFATPPSPVVLTEQAVQVAKEVADSMADKGPLTRKKRGVPPVNLEPLTDDQIAQLTTAVKDDRLKLLKAEEMIHKTLQGIEDTRYKYLVPSTEIACEREVAQVTMCYAKENASAQKKRLALQKQHEAGAAAHYSNLGGEAGIKQPIVAFDTLRCGPCVAELKACTDRMLAAYSDGNVE